MSQQHNRDILEPQIKCTDHETPRHRLQQFESFTPDVFTKNKFFQATELVSVTESVSSRVCFEVLRGCPLFDGQNCAIQVKPILNTT